MKKDNCYTVILLYCYGKNGYGDTDVKNDWHSLLNFYCPFRVKWVLCKCL